MADASNTEIAAAMPWLTANSESWWEVSGTYPGGGSFTDCIARVVPAWITGVDDGVLFELLLYAGPVVVPANRITRGRELMLVLADEPWTAYYTEDQAAHDAAMSRRPEGTDRG